jgi:hypothetical protein
MVKERNKIHAWQWKGELGSDDIAMFLTLPLGFKENYNIKIACYHGYEK